MGANNLFLEEQIIRDLINKSLIKLELKDAFCLKRTYLHPKHEELEFMLDVKQDLAKGKDYLLIYFIVSYDISTHCKSRILEGRKNKILLQLQDYLNDLSPLMNNLPNYYRIIFSNN